MPKAKLKSKTKYPKSPLRRAGNKAKLLPVLMNLFPPKVKTFIDFFMGTGSVSFAMATKCRYVFSNDINDDVYNLWQVIKTDRKELIEFLETTPYHQSIFKHWKKNKELDPIIKAARFLYLSNFAVFKDTFRFGTSNNAKEILLETIRKINLLNLQFLCVDFRKVLECVNIMDKYLKHNHPFLYFDPPYYETSNPYGTPFTKQDTKDVFKVACESGYKFGISEFDNPYVLELAKQHDLIVTTIGERRTQKNRNTEIFISNYKPNILTQKKIF
jgi:DNA adenine methylase